MDKVVEAALRLTRAGNYWGLSWLSQAVSQSNMPTEIQLELLRSLADLAHAISPLVDEECDEQD